MNGIVIAMVGAAVSAGAARQPQAIMADITRLQQEYKSCLTEQSAVLGAGNAETAETILRAVTNECRYMETQLRAVYAATPLPRAHIEELMSRDRRVGEDEGIAMMLKARAAQKR